MRLRQVMCFEFVAEVICYADQARVVNKGSVVGDGDIDHDQDGDENSVSDSVAADWTCNSCFADCVGVAEDSRQRMGGQDMECW